MKVHAIKIQFEMYYYSDVWIGFLCENIVRQVVQLSKLRCPGCEDKLSSPLLHQHEQHSLLDKLRIYFEEVRGTIFPTLPELYSLFQDKLPHSDDLPRDQECYVSIGYNFLATIGAESLFYGRFLSEMNDSYINEAFKVQRKRKAESSGKMRQGGKKAKAVKPVKSENSVSSYNSLNTT